jgi:hypothetical protein
VGQDHGPLDNILKLANIAGPLVAHQALHRSLRHAVDPLSKFPRESLKKKHDKFWDIGPTVSQWGHLQGKDIQAVEQVGAEASGLYGFVEVTVGRRDHPHVNAYRPAAADGFELLLLQNAEELNLSLQRKLAHLI